MLYLWATQRKKEYPFYFLVKKVKEITQYLIRDLNKFGFLGNGHQISLFLFQNYKFNIINNLYLAPLWNYIYILEFSSEKFVGMKFNYILRNILSQLTSFPPPLALEAQAVVDVLDMEFCTKLNVPSITTINHD